MPIKEHNATEKQGWVTTPYSGFGYDISDAVTISHSFGATARKGNRAPKNKKNRILRVGVWCDEFTIKLCTQSPNDRWVTNPDFIIIPWKDYE